MKIITSILSLCIALIALSGCDSAVKFLVKGSSKTNSVFHKRGLEVNFHLLEFKGSSAFLSADIRCNKKVTIHSDSLKIFVNDTLAIYWDLWANDQPNPSLIELDSGEVSLSYTIDREWTGKEVATVRLNNFISMNGKSVEFEPVQFVLPPDFKRVPW